MTVLGKAVAHTLIAIIRDINLVFFMEIPPVIIEKYELKSHLPAEIYIRIILI